MKTDQTSRKLRRQRRIKSQILAYITLAVLLVFIVVIGSFGVRAIAKTMNDYTEKVNTVLEEASSSYESTDSVSEENESVEEVSSIDESYDIEEADN